MLQLSWISCRVSFDAKAFAPIQLLYIFIQRYSPSTIFVWWNRNVNCSYIWLKICLQSCYGKRLFAGNIACGKFGRKKRFLPPSPIQVRKYQMWAPSGLIGNGSIVFSSANTLYYDELKVLPEVILMAPYWVPATSMYPWCSTSSRLEAASSLKTT